MPVSCVCSGGVTSDHKPCGLKQQKFILAPSGGYRCETKVCAGPCALWRLRQEPVLAFFPAPVVPCRLGADWFAATSRHPATFPLRGRPRPAPPLTGTSAVGIRDHPNPVRPRLNSITSAKTLIPDQVRPPGTGTLLGSPFSRWRRAWASASPAPCVLPPSRPVSSAFP